MCWSNIMIVSVTPLETTSSNSNNISTQVLLTDSRTTTNETGQAGAKSLLYLLVLLPFPDLTEGGIQPSWSGGPNVLPAIEMAVEDINRKAGILDNYTLDFVTGDGGCNIVEKLAPSLVKNVFYVREKRPLGIIGPGCSTTTLHMAPITGKDEVALISAHGASTPKLDTEREKYPYTFGGFSSLSSYAMALASFTEVRQWTKIAVLYDNSRVVHRTAYTEITEALSIHPNTEIAFSSGIYSTYIPLDQIQAQFLKVIVLLAGSKLVTQTLCLSYHKGFSFPTHQFLIFERHLSELIQEDIIFDYSGKTYNCSKETMLNEVLPGTLLSNYKVNPSEEDWNSTATINGTSYNDFVSEYEERIKLLKMDESYAYRDSIMKSIWSPLWYDLVWAMATALDSAERYDGVDLQSYGVGMKGVTGLIYNRFQELDFDGMSGRISFNRNSSFVQRNVDVYQINNSQAVYVATISGSHVTKINYGGVYATSEYPKKTIHMHVAATVVVFILISVIGLALVVTHLLTAKFRHDTAVKGSSPRLQHLAYIGCYLLLAAAVTITVPQAFSISDNVYIVLCHAMNLSFSCGYTLIIGTVCAKTWRLYRIFCHYQNPGKMLADRFLFVIVLLLLLVDVAVNTVWASVDHFYINRTSHFDLSSGGDDVVLVVETMCISQYRVVWTTTIIVYNVSILIFAVSLAILTRKVHLPQFQTKMVVIHAYSLFLLFGLGIPLKLIFDNHYIWIVMFLVTVLLCLVLLFLPPLWPAITKGRFTRRVHSQPRPSIITVISNSHYDA